MNTLTIDLAKGTATLERVEAEDGEFGFQNEQVNEFLQEQAVNKTSLNAV